MKRCVEVSKVSALRALREPLAYLPFNIECVLSSLDEQDLTVSYCAYGWNSIVYRGSAKSPSSQKWIAKKNRPNCSLGECF